MTLNDDHKKWEMHILVYHPFRIHICHWSILQSWNKCVLVELSLLHMIKKKKRHNRAVKRRRNLLYWQGLCEEDNSVIIVQGESKKNPNTNKQKKTLEACQVALLEDYIQHEKQWDKSRQIQYLKKKKIIMKTHTIISKSIASRLHLLFFLLICLIQHIPMFCIYRRHWSCASENMSTHRVFAPTGHRKVLKMTHPLWKCHHQVLSRLM